jgi:hypothetical protein
MGRRAGTWVAVASLALALAIALDLLPFLRGPAPYPPEWQWGFRAPPEGGRWLGALATAATLLGLIALCGSEWARCRARVSSFWILAVAPLAGWGLQLGLLDLEPGGAMRTLLDRTVSRSITSYYTAVLLPEARDPIAFLGQHAELLDRFRTKAKHAATHPPGPVLYYRALVSLCERSPRLTGALLRAAGDSPDRVFRAPSSPASHAAALLGALILGALGATSAWPVAAIARRVTRDPLDAARLGVLWCLVPGPVLMTPQFDQALALLVAGAAALLAVATASRRWVPSAILAGVVCGLACFVSYGSLAFLAIGGACVVALAGDKRRAARAAALAVATGGGLVGLTALLGHHPVRSALAALAVHRELYTEPRSYVLWLVFNPLDLALFLGFPVSAALVARTARSWPPTTPAARQRLATLAGLTLLLLSGATRGEVGRIWIPIMPFLLVAALAPAGREATSQREALVAGALLVPLLLVMRLCWTL